MPTFQEYIGSRISRQLTLTDVDGNAYTGYTNGAGLACKVWAGDDQAPVLSPTVTWIDATQGTI